MKSNSLLTRLSSAVLILNMLDALFTVFYTQGGYASESNPLMQAALASSPVLFVLAKSSLVSLSVLLLWRLRHHRMAVAGLVMGAAAYTLIVAYHLNAAYHLSTASQLVAAR